MFTKLLASQLCVICAVLGSLHAGSVTVELTLISYINPTGRDWINQRCDIINGDCENYLKLCLDSPEGLYRGVTDDLNNCLYYTVTSEKFVSGPQTFIGQDLGELPNPLEYNISDWQGGFLIKVATYDEDLGKDDVIDVILYRYEGLPARSLQKAGSGITKGVSGRRQTGTATTLKIKLLVYCSEFYYYPTAAGPSDPCSVYCQPEDSSTGHYNCTETGRRRCLPGWINETSNCLVSTNRQTDINTNTTKVITGPGVDNEAQVKQTGDYFGSHRNLIIGLIAGLFLLLLLIVLLIALLLRNKRKRKLKDQASSAYVNTAVAGQQTATTATNAAGTGTYDNPLYLNKPNSTPADESHYSDVDYGMVKLPLGGSYGHEAIPAGVAKAREADASTDSHYNRNLKYNPKNTQPSPYMQDERSRSNYGMGGNDRGAFGGSDVGMADGVRGGFSPMGADSTTYGLADNRFDNPTYEAPVHDVDVPGKVSVVKKMAGLYQEPIKYKI